MRNNFYKIAIVVSAFVLLFGANLATADNATTGTSGTTTTTSTTDQLQALIKSLQDQISILQTQIKTLTTQQGSSTPGSSQSGNSSSTLNPQGANTSTTGQTVNQIDSTNVHFGARSDDTLELQRFLQSKGYLTEKFVTGYFGPVTRSALQAFQEDHGLSSSDSGYGNFGPTTDRIVNQESQLPGQIITYNAVGYQGQTQSPNQICTRAGGTWSNDTCTMPNGFQIHPPTDVISPDQAQTACSGAGGSWGNNTCTFANGYQIPSYQPGNNNSQTPATGGSSASQNQPPAFVTSPDQLQTACGLFHGTWSNNTCILSGGSQGQNGQGTFNNNLPTPPPGSSTCPAGQYPGPGGICTTSTTVPTPVPNCVSGQYWNGTSCVSSTTSPSTTSTTCSSGQYWYTPPSGGAGYCQSMSTSCTQAGGTWNSSTNYCQMPTCPSGQYWYTPPNGGAGSCVSSTTTTCPSDQYWNGTSCVSSTTTTCPSGQYWNGSSCVSSTTSPSTTSITCPSGQYWNGTSCVSSTTTNTTPTSYNINLNLGLVASILSQLSAIIAQLSK